MHDNVRSVYYKATPIRGFYDLSPPKKLLFNITNKLWEFKAVRRARQVGDIGDKGEHLG